MRPVGQTADGQWEVGVRRTVAVDIETAWTRLRSLLEDHDAVRAIRSETRGEVVRASDRPRSWSEPSTLQLRVLPADSGTSMASRHEHLPSAAAREAMRERWTVALDRLTRGTA